MSNPTHHPISHFQNQNQTQWPNILKRHLILDHIEKRRWKDGCRSNHSAKKTGTHCSLSSLQWHGQLDIGQIDTVVIWPQNREIILTCDVYMLIRYRLTSLRAEELIWKNTKCLQLPPGPSGYQNWLGKTKLTGLHWPQWLLENLKDHFPLFQ